MQEYDEEYQRNHEEFTKKQIARERNQQKFKENSKQRLSQILEKKFKTTMIGAIVSLEETFGYLWGHGERYEDLNIEEKRFRNLWEKARNEILNKGNNQCRGALDELINYEISPTKYQTKFIVRNENER